MSDELHMPLRKPVMYLSGPIQNVAQRSEAADWRNEIKERYADEFNFIDPMDNEWNTDQKTFTPNVAADIVATDKMLILGSDILLAYIPFPSVGTSMEIMWAHMLGKHVIIWRPDVAPLSAWIIEHSHYIAAKLSGAIMFARNHKHTLYINGKLGDDTTD